jgi:hypothetical protein
LLLPQVHKVNTLSIYASAERPFLEFCTAMGISFDMFSVRGRRRLHRPRGK